MISQKENYKPIDRKKFDPICATCNDTCVIEREQEESAQMVPEIYYAADDIRTPRMVAVKTVIGGVDACPACYAVAKLRWGRK
jgi:hypothetical protein